VSEIGDYYERVEQRRREAQQLVRHVEDCVARKAYADALSLIEQAVGKVYFKKKIACYFKLEDACAAGLARLREKALRAGNTGD
jgi:hypothetical protein